MYDYIVVGCGLSGAVVANRIATILNKKVLILEKRDHIGGNCYDYVDPETNIRLNKYGAHLFHTNCEKVWTFINQFCEWQRWEHQVLAYTDGQYVSMPVNITTVNKLCKQNIQTEEEMAKYMETAVEKYDVIENSEQMAKSRIGTQLYEKLVKDYTFKQWAKYPSELDKTVLARIPVRHNFDTRYFSDKYQALPKKGYTYFFEQLLNNKNIEVKLNTEYQDIYGDTPVIYTGPIDQYFDQYEKLEYRSVDFHIERHDYPYHQPNSVVNYPSKNIEYTRCVEYKHFLNQPSDKTIIVFETTNDNGDPYYPVPNKRNMDLYEKYRKLAEKEEQLGKTYFLGRLANYKYYNMDQAIEASLDFFEEKIYKNT